MSDNDLPAILGEFERELRVSREINTGFAEQVRVLEERNRDLESGKYRPYGGEMLATGAIFDPPIHGDDVASISYERSFGQGGAYKESFQVQTHRPAFGSGVSRSSDGQPRTRSGESRVSRRSAF